VPLSSVLLSASGSICAVCAEPKRGRQPFRPFTVKLVGGRSFTVRHPENISCSLDGREIVIHDEEGMNLIEALMPELMEPVKKAIKPARVNGA
jgi:hypothetical protein